MLKALTQKTILLQEDSQVAETLEKINGLLQGNLLDVLFIDGDHTYEGVKRDFTMYKSIVKPGGLIVLHDVAVSHYPNSTIDHFWAELKQGSAKTGEWIANEKQGWAGIGWVES